ncbi:MAG: SGNH/GDSL hydrolase family protein [Anaerolineales bacterium]|nr:SGNH/GDSL hydrolase family protein [Anaerolineales bacterium]
MKIQPAPFLLLIIPILICSSCNLLSAKSVQYVNPLGQMIQTEQPPVVGANQTEVKLEKNDWSNIWIENANQSEKTRILFVGDSITDGYYTQVKENLSPEYYLGYYVTSKFIGNPDFQTELTTILDRYEFEIIQINNGLHGWDYSIDDYQKGLEELKGILDDHAPNALIIWCMTTQVRVEDNLESLDKLNQDVTLRNQSALEILGENGVLINDLYQGMLKHPEYYRYDGFHFNDAGKEALA